MIGRNLSNRTQIPYNQALKYGYIAPTVWYDFSIGYGGNVPIARDLTGNGYNGTLNNLSSSWLPSSHGGMMNLNNTSGYNPGAGKTIVLPITSVDSYSFVIGFELTGMNLTYGADIIVGAYNSSTHDWWFGLNSSGYFVFSRNGSTVILNAQTPQTGRRFLIRVNSSTSQYGVKIWDSFGTSWGSAATVGASASTAGNIGIGKYGNYVDNYLSNIKLSNFLYWSGSQDGGIQDETINTYKYKLGIP